MSDEIRKVRKVRSDKGIKRPGIGNAGKGRVKGVQNKVTKALKEQILGALEVKGGQKWLVEQMDANPTAMLTLIGRVLPTTINANVSARNMTDDEARERLQQLEAECE